MSRGAPILARFLLGVLLATSGTIALFFTCYLNNLRDCDQDQPLQRWGSCSSWKVAGRDGDAEPGETCASVMVALFQVAEGPKAGAEVKRMPKSLSPHHQRISQISPHFSIEPLVVKVLALQQSNRWNLPS